MENKNLIMAQKCFAIYLDRLAILLHTLETNQSDDLNPIYQKIKAAFYNFKYFYNSLSNQELKQINIKLDLFMNLEEKIKQNLILQIQKLEDLKNKFRLEREMISNFKHPVLSSVSFEQRV